MLCFRKHHKDTPPKNSPVAFCRYRSVFVGMCRRKPALSGYMIDPIAYLLTRKSIIQPKIHFESSSDYKSNLVSKSEYNNI